MQVYTLTITHRHGMTTYTAVTKELAAKALFKYVEDNWGDVDPEGDRPMPQDEQDAIDAYFEYQGRRLDPEDYMIDLSNVITCEEDIDAIV